MQPGMIILWYGEQDGIPDGWVICEGPTPIAELLNAFIVGAGNLYDVGDGWLTELHGHTDTYLAGRHNLTVGPWVYLGGIMNRETELSIDSFTSDPEKSEPPYKALYFIQKT